jgi:hypothetical protein
MQDIFQYTFLDAVALFNKALRMDHRVQPGAGGQHR